jgi:electron transport complex protein RnfB
MITVVASVAILGIAGIIFGALLAFSAKKFAVEVDSRIEGVNAILPGANCGACGAAGCFSFAESVVTGKLDPTACVPGKSEVAQKIGEILGLAVKDTVEMRAVVHCKGGLKEAKQRFEYFGIEDCTAAELLSGGNKACIYGCLGLDSCVRVCPFNAMIMNNNALPEIFPDLCTGCGLCVKACPRNIIELIPKAQKVYIACINPEKGKAVKEVCEVGCTGCTLCANPKTTPSGDIVMDGNLPKIRYTDNKNLIAGAYRCAPNSFVVEITFPPVNYERNVCNGCPDQPKALCTRICPVKNCITFEAQAKKAVFNKDLCVGCELCIAECPVGAFEPALKTEGIEYVLK